MNGNLDKKNGFLYAKAAVAALCGAFTAAFGDGVGFDFEGVVLPVVLVWYIFTELGSIAENGAAMGAPVPSWLLSLLAESKEKAAK